MSDPTLDDYTDEAQPEGLSHESKLHTAVEAGRAKPSFLKGRGALRFHPGTATAFATASQGNVNIDSLRSTPRKAWSVGREVPDAQVHSIILSKPHQLQAAEVRTLIAQEGSHGST